jgi:hypothetical protein
MRLGVASLILRLFCCDDGMDERSAVSIDGVAHRLNALGARLRRSGVSASWLAGCTMGCAMRGLYGGECETTQALPCAWVLRP